MSAKRQALNCAIYTRKSSEEGLEQDFNSLDAQREACEAFVLSQQHEGWRAIATQYDDGGYSGGNMDRPALKRLLEDIDNKRIQVVVVYKVDRLTRSLADFAKIVERFDVRGVSFVSVTQQFNTTSSMGRLTLNVLLSFAQFEREVTGERIRDKIAASKQKGMWMGGTPPIGYRGNARTLEVEESSASLIRHIFSRYLALGSVHELKRELDAENRVAPNRVSNAGNTYGGVRFSRGQLYRILTNPIYIGQIAHREKTYIGQHSRIIDPELWDAVQAKMISNRQGHRQ
ncbi:recombinase family protein [Candidatus Ferrigenium straubiae]|jgi:DNA invertase Pin-like site-specific DNA recombinase|uniref:recombinase family protein n=1 Tax=Candidatus Ferrigenium straubiae TaxID=2919506 RepID=UPI003F4AA64D